MKLTSSDEGQDDGTINWPVGDNISGPASLKIKIIEIHTSFRGLPTYELHQTYGSTTNSNFSRLCGHDFGYPYRP